LVELETSNQKSFGLVALYNYIHFQWLMFIITTAGVSVVLRLGIHLMHAYILSESISKTIARRDVVNVSAVS
jgi:hypothetical protein